MTTTVFKKIAAVFLGLIMSLVLLEAGLRLGGFALASMQAYENFRSAKQKGAYRILCLGESTTDRQYPQPLERILNQRNIGVRFSVIDEGKTTINSTAILSRVESYLAEYHPDMVVAMMGINDQGIKYYRDIAESRSWIFRHCRVYRFGRMLNTHILKKIKSEGIYGSGGSHPGGKAKLKDAGTLSGKTNPSNKTSAEKVTPLDLKDTRGIPGSISSYPNGRKISSAKEVLGKDVKRDRENDIAYVELGRTYLNQGKFSQAENFLGKAILLDPENEKAYAELGRLYRLQGKAFQAKEFFEKTIELDPRNDRAYVGLGRVYLLQNKSAQAEDSFRKAMELNPKNDLAYVGLGYFFRGRGEFSQAEDFFKKAIELNPKNANNYVKLGRLYRERGRFPQAEGSYKKAIELAPENANNYVGLGNLYRERGEFSQAKDSYKKAIELDPENTDTYVGLGDLYRERGKLSKAEDLYRKAVEIDPKNDQAYDRLGWLCKNREKFQQAKDFLARDFFKKAVEINPKNDSAHFGLGTLYQEQGKFPQAEDSFKKAIGVHPRSARALGVMGSLYEEMGKPSLAKEYAEKARRLGLENYPATTVNNHRKLKEILDRKGIKLVCVQYPMRNMEPLERIFENDKGVIFVDNESIFKEAVKKGGYKKYFRDMFAGDFGHCTVKGNELLAQNIADVILKEVFNKS